MCETVYWQGLYAGVSCSNERSERYFASKHKSKRNSRPQMSLIQQAYMKNCFAKSCTPARGCSWFPRGVQSGFPASWYRVLRGAVAKRGAMRPSVLVLVLFFQTKGEQTQTAVACVKASTGWYGFSVGCSIVATPIFHYRLSSHVVFIYVSSFC